MAPDSQMVRSLALGSTRAGRRPLGLILRKVSSLGFAMTVALYGMDSSSRTKRTLRGFGPWAGIC